jgi:hypothetical protein
MSISSEKIQSVEANLSQALQRVRPSRDFVETIGRRIRSTAPKADLNRPRDRESLFLVVGGVLSASLLILTLARGIFYLLNRSKA